ncbi:FlgD immunoglobulin-like domain containing protein [Sulfurimonas hydrogeniphila]|uniref:FlgD immunoglobulin-like domain containing protein n=1 Tax=Sulfurimonas TaxID=202746 RepID=UPI00125F678C|nr:FlgD immunoglobulin-like domain containing protein [Sulfurimonas hydrogeniphila]
MAINSIGQDTSVYGDYTTGADVVEDKTSLSNDDFMTLLLVELQNQDPTEPTDTEQILTQTSQLATLEATDNTNKALEDLAATMAASSDFSAISAIGKTADLGSNAITYTEGEDTSFEIYFPSDVASGNVEILDSNGNIIQTITAEQGDAGIYTYTWDGKDSAGNSVDEGIYYATASYTNSAGESLTARVGTYPIESVRFDAGETYVKVGSGYVPLANVVEIY